MCIVNLNVRCTRGSQLQWNLRTKDTMGPAILSLVERSSLSQRSNNRVSFVERSSLSQRSNNRVSFVERSSLSRRVPYRRFHRVVLLHGWLFLVMANPRDLTYRSYTFRWLHGPWRCEVAPVTVASQRLTDCVHTAHSVALQPFPTSHMRMQT